MGAVAIAHDLRNSFTNLLIHGYVDRALVRLAILTGLVGLVLEVWLVVRLVRRHLHDRRELGKSPAITRKQLAFIRKLLELLKRHGLPLRRNMTPRELAGQAAVTLNLPASVLAGLIELYYRMRWGHQALEAEELRAAEAEVDKLSERLSRRGLLSSQ